MIFQILFAIDKVLHQGRNVIGKSILVTVLGSILPIFAQVGLIVYFFVVLKFLKGYAGIMTDERRSEMYNRFAVLETSSKIIAGLSFTFSMMPTVGLIFPAYQRQFAMAYLIGDGCVAWIYGILTTSALHYLLTQLREHVTNFRQASAEMRLVLQRLTAAYYMIAVMSLTIGISFTIFGYFDSFLRKSTYLFIFQQIICPPCSTLLVLTVSRITKATQIKPFTLFTDVIPTPNANSENTA
jgi:hypothetical protein